MNYSYTVSIVTYNGSKDIVACLDSLKAQTLPAKEIIVVDNDSKDDTVALVKDYHPDVTVIETGKNLGFGGGHNIGIAQAKTDWVLLVNQDMRFEVDAVEQLMKRTNDERIAAIGPCLYRDQQREVIDTTGLIKTFYGAVSDRGAGQSIQPAWQVSSPMWGISGACVLYRKKALEEIAYERSDRAYPEYFDETFFMYKEDIDLAARLRRARWKAWYEATSIAYHRRTGRAAKRLSDFHENRQQLPDYINVNSYKNHLFYLIKNTSILNLIPVVVYELLKFGYLAFFERNTLKGLSDVKQHWSLMWNRRYV